LASVHFPTELVGLCNSYVSFDVATDQMADDLLDVHSDDVLAAVPALERHRLASSRADSERARAVCLENAAVDLCGPGLRAHTDASLRAIQRWHPQTVDRTANPYAEQCADSLRAVHRAARAHCFR
jgi:hypothetical protein